jgi:tetraacyldisaccharide 4'-kinase
LIRALSLAYGRAAVWRRRWYEADSSRRRRLRRPVVSVGNLRVGGTGKTPIVVELAKLLLAEGERPAILSRGYARRCAPAGVTVVSDGFAVRAALDAAGDEPLLLARCLPRASVFVCSDRYLAGRLAEERFGATIHLLDDGFQHLELARTADLLLVGEDDLNDSPLPGGRLREPIEVAGAADAVLVDVGYATAADRIARSLGVASAFRVTRALGAPRMIAGGDTVVVPSGSRVCVVAGIGRPERFVGDIVSAGWQVVESVIFRDHHPYTKKDVERIGRLARTAGSAVILTTEKDAVRFEACDLGDLPIASVPLLVGVEPSEAFRDWLFSRIRDARAALT